MLIIPTDPVVYQKLWGTPSRRVRGCEALSSRHGGNTHKDIWDTGGHKVHGDTGDMRHKGHRGTRGHLSHDEK